MPPKNIDAVRPVAFADALREASRVVTPEMLRGKPPPPRVELASVERPGDSGFTQGMSDFGRKFYDGNQCNGVAGGQEGAGNMVECMIAQIMTQKGAELILKYPGKYLYKTLFRTSLERMASEGVAKGLTSKMSETLATKIVEKAMVERAEEEVAEALVEAAVETELGPVGWALEIGQAISMIMDLGDAENYNKMMGDHTIENMVGNMERGIAEATTKQACAVVDQLLSNPPWSEASMESAALERSRCCLKCRFRQWPPRKRPFHDFHNVHADPALHSRLQAYMIDYMRWMPRGTTPALMRSATNGYLSPPHHDATGSPNYDGWVPRLYNSLGHPVLKPPKDAPPPDVRKYAFTTLQQWFLSNIIPFAFTQNYALASRMQQSRASINVCLILMGIIVLLVVFMIGALLRASSRIALGK